MCCNDVISLVSITTLLPPLLFFPFKAFTVDTNDPSEGYPAYVDEAYWPKQLAEAVDLKWCEELLTDHGADPNWPVDCFVETREKCGELPVQGLSVLLHAVLKGNIPVVRLLLKHKADPNQFEIEVYSTCSYDMFATCDVCLSNAMCCAM